VQTISLTKDLNKLYSALVFALAKTKAKSFFISILVTRGYVKIIAFGKRTSSR
jgi:hypothetical protein